VCGRAGTSRFSGAGSLGPVQDLSALTTDWPVDRVAVGATTPTETIGTGGEQHWAPRIASISKLLTAYAGLVAIEEGTISLADPAGRAGATVEHLLAHAAGYGFNDGDPLADVGSRRVYSNVGIEVFAEHLAASAGMPFADYLNDGVLAPLGMVNTRLVGSPAHGVHASVEDLLAFARELLNPRLVSPETLADATRPHFPELSGVLPSVGRFDPNPWGLGFEIRGDKQPHWTGAMNSPRTFGHFGGTGTFLWVDPDARLAAVALGNRNFGPWSLEVWPPFSDAVLASAAH